MGNEAHMNKTDSSWGNIFKAKDGDLQTLVQQLKHIPLFAGLSKGELKEIERLIHLRQYKSGEVIFWEDEPGVGMYVVHAGEVGIYKAFGTPEQRELAHLHTADFFGETALLEDESRLATAVALADSRLLGLFHPDFFDLFERKPQLGVKLLVALAGMLAKRLRRTNLELQELTRTSRPAGLRRKTAP
jgi:CRP/FNR family transcriptional regulator, cyclic AMP receptor protein